MRIGTKLLLGFIPLAILTAMVAEVLYINSTRITESSRLVKESTQTYLGVLEIRRHEKNFAFYHEKFYLDRLNEACGRAAESLSRLKDLAGGTEVATQFTRAEESLGEYRRLAGLLAESGGPAEAARLFPQLDAAGQQMERSAERMVALSWAPIQVANEKARTYSWIFAFQAALIGLVLAFYFARLLVRPIRQLLRATRKVSEGDFSPVVSLSSRDEIGELAESFNRMIRSLEQGRSELQKSGQELRKTKETLENIVQSSVDAIVATDPKGRITFANRSMQEMFLGNVPGREEKILGTPMAALYSGGLAEARKIMSALRERGRLINYETTMMSAGGGVIPILTSASLLKDERGAVIGTLGIIKDLTEKKRLEEDLKKAQGDLVQTERLAAVGRLASGVAHEMNDPLTSILTFGNLLREDTQEADASRESLDIILKEANRAKRIVSDLLSFSREAKPSLEWIDLNDVLNMSLLLLEKQGAVEGIEVRLELGRELPLVRADSGQLQQVFTNILLNAMQAMALRGSPEEIRPLSGKNIVSVRTGFHESGENSFPLHPSMSGPFIRIVIEDTGPGIPPEIQGKIFDPFFTTKPTGEGTGLGLYIVSGILKNYGARYHLDSEAGRGTTFTIDFPLSNS